MDQQLGGFANRIRGAATNEDASDADLLAYFVRDRNEVAFELLLRRYHRLVWGVCQRVLLDHQHTEDAFQATFLTLARKADSIRADAALGSWLHQVAYRVAVRSNQKRGRGDEKASSDQLAEQVSGTASPEESAVRREWETLLDEELNRLPDRHRLPIILCYLQGKTYTEAAQHLDWPVGTVATRLTQARDKLHQRLTSRGVTLAVSAFTSTALVNSASANVTEVVMARTLQAGLEVAIGEPVSAGLVSVHAMNLSEEVIAMTTPSKLSKVTLALGGLILATTSAYGVYTYASGPGDGKPKGAPPAQAEAPRKPHPLAVVDRRVVAVAKLTRVRGTGVQESFPPTYNYQVSLEVVVPVEGPLRKGQTITARYSITQVKEPALPTGKRQLISLHQDGKHYRIVKLENNDRRASGRVAEASEGGKRT